MPSLQPRLKIEEITLFLIVFVSRAPFFNPHIIQGFLRDYSASNKQLLFKDMWTRKILYNKGRETQREKEII